MQSRGNAFSRSEHRKTVRANQVRRSRVREETVSDTEFSSESFCLVVSTLATPPSALLKAGHGRPSRKPRYFAFEPHFDSAANGTWLVRGWPKPDFPRYLKAVSFESLIRAQSVRSVPRFLSYCSLVPLYRPVSRAKNGSLNFVFRRRKSKTIYEFNRSV